MGSERLIFTTISESVDFISSHFHSLNGAFPRKMMTLKSNGQFTVKSKDEILRKCIQSDYRDCRINAYPENLLKDGVLIQPPNFAFIDLDLANFNNDIKKLDKVKDSTLRKMSELSAFPTVSWTGNGYHIYLPLNISILDHVYVFSKDKFPYLFSSRGKYSHYYVSEVFMQFVEDYFTSGKADPQHRPKYKTCLIRIPETYNTKCIILGKNKEESKVKIIQKWNTKRIDVEFLVPEFRSWLMQEELNLKEYSNKKQKLPIRKTSFKYSKYHNKNSSLSNSKIRWIENLLETPLEDHRKYSLWRILGPYLLNIRQMSEIHSVKIMEEWLDKCHVLRRLDFDPKTKIYGIVKGNKGFRPISYSKLKDENKHLYLLLNSKYVIDKQNRVDN